MLRKGWGGGCGGCCADAEEMHAAVARIAAECLKSKRKSWGSPGTEKPGPIRGPTLPAARTKRTGFRRTHDDARRMRTIGLCHERPSRHDIDRWERPFEIAAQSLSLLRMVPAGSVADDGDAARIERGLLHTVTLFQAGSISKAITSVAALCLVDRGVLQLDRPVDARLRSWSIPPHDGRARIRSRCAGC